MTYSKVHREVRKFISRCLTRYETPRKKKVQSRHIEDQNGSREDRRDRRDQKDQSEGFRVKECHERQDKNLHSVPRNVPLIEGSVLESKTRLTDYINSCIVQEVLDRPERIKYRRCLKLLSETMFNSASIDIQDIAEHSGEEIKDQS